MGQAWRPASLPHFWFAQFRGSSFLLFIYIRNHQGMALPGVRIVLGVGLHDQSGRSSCIIVPLRWKIKLCSRDTMEAMEAGLPEPWPEIFGSSRVFCLVSGVLGWILYYCFLQSQRGREPPQLRPKELGVGLPGSSQNKNFLLHFRRAHRPSGLGPGSSASRCRSSGSRSRSSGSRCRARGRGRVEVASRGRRGPGASILLFCPGRSMSRKVIDEFGIEVPELW